MTKDHPRHFVGLESDLITIEKMNDTYRISKLELK